MHKNAIGGLDYDTKERMEDAEEEFRILDLRIQSTMEDDPTHWIEQQARKYMLNLIWELSGDQYVSNMEE